MCNHVGIETNTMEKVKLVPMYKCLLHNDDYNDMDNVVMALQDVFKFEVAKAISVMMEAHNNGVALCVIEPMEHAEFHSSCLKSYGLTSTIEPDK